MNKCDLAYGLRQLDNGEGDSIEEIIDSWITCSRCGERQVSDEALGFAIEKADTINEFFYLCKIIGIARTTTTL